MRVNFNILKSIAIALGIFSFVWMIYDFLSNRKNINKHYLSANVAFLEKKYKKAFELYDLALNQDPGNVYYLEGKARTLFRMEKFTEAEKIFKDVIKKDEEFTAAIANLGILYDTIGMHENAIKYYKLAVEKDSKVTDGMSWLKRFLKNIHFKPSNVKERLNFLEKELKSENISNLKNQKLDNKQPDFEM